MKLQKGCKIEAVTSGDMTRQSITAPWLEIADGTGTLIATDGRAMAILPVEPGEHDVTGYVSEKALAAARKLVRKGEQVTVQCNGACTLTDGASFPRPFADDSGVKYPQWRQVLPDATRESKLRVTLDPALLARLASALGVEDGQGVTLEFGKDEFEPVRVTGGTAGGIGVLMLMRHNR